ncbi:MAG TPA: serine/threonine-protein kinase, partial [Planctomycetota bacterium]|nr:serine/threonine-protein kinase [Planctomycetota bacterium]
MTEPRKDTLKEIGGFELISKIGQGGMGAVFKARQKSLDRIVALKVLPPSIAKDAKFIERFQREARACAKLNHPNIVQGVDVGKDEATGVWYFAMEFIDGASALKLLKSQGTVPEERALEIARDVARALECAAANGIVHRDIKPDNILLTSRGDAKLADLGLAKQMNKAEDASLTQSGQAIGTPYYMAPEQVRGASAEIDIRTDIYALGGTLYHLVTGQPPYSGETSALIMSRHLTEPPPKASKTNPKVSEACSRLIEKMMQKEREKRVQSPAELIEQIEKALRGETITGPRPQLKVAAHSRRKEAIEKPASKLPLVLGLAGVGAVIAVVLLLKGSSAPEKSAKVPETRVAAGPEAARKETKPNAAPAAPAPAKKSEPKKTSPAKIVTEAAASAVAESAAQTPALDPALAIVPGPAAGTQSAEKVETPAVKSSPVSTAAIAAPEKGETAAKADPAPAETKKPAAVAAPDAAPQKVELPFTEVLAALRERAPAKAIEKVGDGTSVQADALREALKLLAAQRESRYAAITESIGQNVKFDSVKGAQNGKLVAFKNGVLQIERAIMINGASAGSTMINVPFDELTQAMLERIKKLPPPASPADWTAAALSAMADGRLDAAEAAVNQMGGAALQETLASELKKVRVSEREAQARAAWAKIEARAAEAPSQSKAKQLNDELAAYAKKFGDSDFASAPETAAKMAEFKEKFERLALGLDPRVLQLFKGRVLNYDARTQVITLGYDFSTKEQNDDFIDSLWAPPGDHTGLTWRKGELRTFCKGTADRVFKMPQFQSGSLNMQLTYKKKEAARARFEVEVSFYGLESAGKTPKVSFRASEKGCVLLSNNAELKSNADEILLSHDGVLELSCQADAFVVKLGGKPLFEHTLPKPNDHTGFWIGGG